MLVEKIAGIVYMIMLRSVYWISEPSIILSTDCSLYSHYNNNR